MLLEFTQDEYNAIPKPRRTNVMRWIRKGWKDEVRSSMVEPEVRWAFLVEGKCLSEIGRTKAEAWERLGFGPHEYDRITIHGSYDEAVKRGWWVEAAPGVAEEKAEHSGLLDG